MTRDNATDRSERYDNLIDTKLTELSWQQEITKQDIINLIKEWE